MEQDNIEINNDIEKPIFAIESNVKVGIDQNKEGLVTPNCDKSQKRGRNSISELREKDEEAENQVKFSSMLNVGKGKFLPTEP